MRSQAASIQFGPDGITDNQLEQVVHVGFNQLKEVRELGHGSFGKVSLVEAPDGQQYALKELKLSTDLPTQKNIYKELHDDLGCYIPNNGYLVKWAEQGVLMLNAVLTVRAHKPASHQGKGWEEFTDAAIRAVNNLNQPVVFLLWGNFAKKKAEMLDNPNHLILTAPHPSPYSASSGFFGCKHFSQANDFLQKHGVEPIDWQIENI